MVVCAYHSCARDAETGRYLEAHWPGALGKSMIPRFRDLASKERSDGVRYPPADLWPLHAYVCTHQHEYVHTTHTCTYLWLQNKAIRRNAFQCFVPRPWKQTRGLQARSTLSSVRRASTYWLSFSSTYWPHTSPALLSSGLLIRNSGAANL